MHYQFKNKNKKENTTTTTMFWQTNMKGMTNVIKDGMYSLKKDVKNEKSRRTVYISGIKLKKFKLYYPLDISTVSTAAFLHNTIRHICKNAECYKIVLLCT